MAAIPSFFPDDLVSECGPPNFVFEIGVGAGFDALRFCQRNFRYIGIDRSEAATTLSKERLKSFGYSESVISQTSLEKVCLEEAPDLIFERGVFHNQSSIEAREAFTLRCAQLLAPNGYWISIIGCNDSTCSSPHGALKLKDVIEAVEPLFTIKAILRRPYGPPNWPGNFDAWHCLFKLRM